LEDNLQFQKAEFEDSQRKCALCQVPIDRSYYHLAGHVVCPNCAAQRAELQKPVPGQFGRAVLYGLGGALAGSAIYAIVSITTGFHLSLISILVGFIVGKAIKRGTRGRGGRKLQILAVLLTYGAITTSYIPEMLQSVKKRSEKQEQSKTVQIAQPRPTVLRLAMAIAFLIAISLAAPILYLLGSPGGGLLNALILFFGLMQAWKMTAGDSAVLMGPYQTEPV
jgi:hypothetical protein